MLAALICFVLLASPQPDCADAASCRQASLDAVSRGDFDTAHDLAWRAIQKGRPNDPQLMELVARTQSLSGRPGDALVMLRRMGQMGIAIDAATSDDFRRVRALPGWPEVESLLKAASTGVPSPPADKPAEAALAKASKPKAAVREAPTAPVVSNEEPLPDEFAPIQPAGLAYDAVSRRFIVGDRRENRLMIFDDVFKRVTSMVGAESAGFFGLTALEIDGRRGDLWVTNSNAVEGASLHKLQLISGRVLFGIQVPPKLGSTAFVDVAILGGGEVLLLDAQGRRLIGVSPAGRVFRTIARTNVEGATSVASTSSGIAFVAHAGGLMRVDMAARTTTAVRGAPDDLLRIRAYNGLLVGVRSTGSGQRIVQIRLDPAGRKVLRAQVLDDSVDMPDASAMAVADGMLHYLTASHGITVIRRAKIGPQVVGR